MCKSLSVILILFGMMTITPTQETAASQPSQPNIIFMMADDMGYGDLGCYNDQSKIPTPNMDKLASQGLRFTDAHTPSSVCSPTRYGVVTGRYAWRSSLKYGVLWGFDHPMIEPQRTTVASLLSTKGYRCGVVGKWHLGLGWSLKNGESKPWQLMAKQEPHNNGWEINYAKELSGGPLDLGFDYFFGIAASNNMPPYCFIENRHVVGNPNVMKTPLNYGNTKSPMVKDWDDAQYGPNFTQKAIQFIENHQKQHSEKPFFLYFPSQAPHRPCLPPKFAKGKSKAGLRGDMVWEFDWSVGQMVQTLDRLKLTENTLLIVTSDNGATPGDPFPRGAKKRNGNGYGKTYDHVSCGDWRGYKAQIWEGGHRVPFIVRWHHKVKPGTISNETICLTDLLATVAAVTNTPLPKEAAPDSINILPALLGEKNDHPLREAIVHHDALGQFAIRQGDWKYIAPLEAIVRQRKVNRKGGLYNLKTDPQETQNLIQQEQKIAQQLSALLKKYQQQNHSLRERRSSQ